MWKFQRVREYASTVQEHFRYVNWEWDIDKTENSRSDVVFTLINLLCASQRASQRNDVKTSHRVSWAEMWSCALQKFIECRVRRTITRLSSFQLFEKKKKKKKKLKNWKIKIASSQDYLWTFNHATSIISYFSYEYWREIFANFNLNKEYTVFE
jgi:hypothetical protein